MAAYPVDPSEAKALLKIYCDLVERRRSIPDWLTTYIYSSFKYILDSVRKDSDLAAKALGLSYSKRGRPRRHRDRDTKIADDVKKLMASGKTLFDASLILSEKYHLHESHIQKIYSARVKFERDMPF